MHVYVHLCMLISLYASTVSRVCVLSFAPFACRAQCNLCQYHVGAEYRKSRDHLPDLQATTGSLIAGKTPNHLSLSSTDKGTHAPSLKGPILNAAAVKKQAAQSKAEITKIVETTVPFRLSHGTRLMYVLVCLVLRVKGSTVQLPPGVPKFWTH